MYISCYKKLPVIRNIQLVPRGFLITGLHCKPSDALYVLSTVQFNKSFMNLEPSFIDVANSRRGFMKLGYVLVWVKISMLVH